MSHKLLPQLKSIINFAYNNPYCDFYRKKFDATGLDPRSIKTFEDFQKIPFATKEELITKDPDELLFLPLDTKRMDLAYSSGSSGKGLSVIYRFYANQERVNHLKQTFNKCKRILLIAGVRQIIGQSLSILKTNKMIVPADMNNLEAAAILAGKVKIDAIQAPPLILMDFAKQLKKYYDPKNIMVVSLLGGKSPTSLEKNVLGKLYPSAVVLPFYGMSENGLGHLGTKCKHLLENPDYLKVYHPFPNCFFEICDGEIIFTHLK